MAQPSEKKRKRAEDGSTRPKKKAATSSEVDKAHSDASIAHVSSSVCPKHALPVIASTTGISVPPDAKFAAYNKKGTKGRDMILHSTTHRTLDYTAREDDAAAGARTLKHYIAIYDPETRKMEVVEAKKMTVRGTVRAKQAPAEALQPPGYQRMAERRADLTSAFGTKKAKDVIKNDLLNKITTQMDTENDPASRAILERIGEVAGDMATQEQLQAAVTDAKPVPPPNLEAEEIQDVYNPAYLLGPEVLNMISVSDWQDALARQEGIQCTSRFVAHRVARVASSSDPVPRLRLLRYLLWMISFYQLSRPGARGVRKLPPRDKLRQMLAPAPDAVVDSLRRNFSEGSEMRKFNIDMLMTYACVFALIIENFEMDSADIREDLRLEQKAIDTYFHEVGARTKIVTDKSSGKAVNRYHVRLALPLHFPKQRIIRAKRR